MTPEQPSVASRGEHFRNPEVGFDSDAVQAVADERLRHLGRVSGRGRLDGDPSGFALLPKVADVTVQRRSRILLNRFEEAASLLAREGSRDLDIDVPNRHPVMVRRRDTRLGQCSEMTPERDDSGSGVV